MKFSITIICAISFLLIIFFAQSTGQINPRGSTVESSEVIKCRKQIEKIIETAMALGDQRGIELISLTANSTTCLSLEDTTMGNLYHKTGVLYYINNSSKDAIIWFKKALPIREKNTNNSIEPLLNTLNGLAQSHLQLFHYDSAEQFIERQLVLIEKSKGNYDETIADLYLADAQLAYSIEDYTRCREKLIVAANHYQNINTNTFNHGVVQNMLGATTDLLNQPAKAIEHYKLAIQIFDLNQEVNFKALTFHNMGMAYAKLKMIDSALTYLNSSYDIHILNYDSIEIGRHCIEMAKIEADRKQIKHAKYLAQKSLRIREKILPEWHNDVIESLLVLGSITMQEAEKEKIPQKENEALALFDKALNAAIKSPRKERAIEPMANKAILFAKQGKENIEMAIKAHTLFLQVDSMVRLSRLQYRHQESKIEFTQKIRNTYEQAIKNALGIYESTKNKKYFEDALLFCEKSKATAVRDKLHKQAVRVFAGIPDSLLAQERQLSLQLGAATQTLLSIANKTDSSYIVILKNLESVKNKMEEFDKSLEKKFPQYYKWLREPEQNASLEDVQEALEPGSILIEYFLGIEQVFVFGVSKKKYQYWLIDKTDSTLTPIDNFIQNVETSKSFSPLSTCENAYKSYKLLLEKPLNYFVAQDNVSNLKIVPDGIIANVPFDALITNPCRIISPDAPYLIKKYSHSLLYSNLLLLNKGENKQWFGKKECAIFGIDYMSRQRLFGDSVYQSLPFIEEEVMGVQQLNGGDLFLNSNATLYQLKDKLNEAEILHIAVHGSFNEDNPGNSGLIFSKKNATDTLNNILSLSAIYGLHTNAQFIYLSTCFSGKGNIAASEGIMSLSRAFTYAGVKSQVITLWEVSDRASAIITKKFYHHLTNGKTKDDALRLAKLEYIEDSPTAFGQNPFFWAGSVVVGNSESLYQSDIIFSPICFNLIFFVYLDYNINHYIMALPKQINIKESITELKSILKASSPLIAPRIRVLIALKENEKLGISKREVADMVGVNHNSVQTWRSMYIKGGLKLVQSHNKKGFKPSVFNQEEHAAIEKKLQNPKNGLRGYVELKAWIEQEFKKHVKYNTLLKYSIKNFGSKVKVARKSHIKKDDSAVETFKKTSIKSVKKPSKTKIKPIKK